jgi:hypothetical protein
MPDAADANELANNVDSLREIQTASFTPVSRRRSHYSRDHRPDCPQLVIAMVVTPEGFPLSYEVFDGDRADVTKLEAMLDQVEAKYGRARRVWVFDRGIVSEANLEKLRQRGGQYVVGTPRQQLAAYEKALLEGSWQQINDSVQVQLLEAERETYVLARSVDRAKKEEAMRWRQLRGLMRDLVKLRRSIRKGTLVDPAKALMRLGRLSERWPRAWPYMATDWEEGKLTWHWDRQALRLAQQRDGAYLLRTNLTDRSPQALWRMYATDGSRGGVSGVEERFGHSADLAPGGTASRSARDGCVSGILPLGLLETEAQGGRSGAQSVAGAGSVPAGDASGSVVQTEGGRGDLPAADHPTRAGPGVAVAPDGLVITRTTAAANLQGSDSGCVADLTGKFESFLESPRSFLRICESRVRVRPIGARKTQAKACGYMVLGWARSLPNNLAAWLLQFQPLPNIRGDFDFESRERFEQSLNVRQILQTFALAPLWLLERPDLADNQIFRRGDVDLSPDNGRRSPPHQKILKDRVRLNLDANARVLVCQIQAVPEPFDLAHFSQRLFQLRQPSRCHDNIEVQGNNRRRVGIDRHAANDAVLDPLRAEQPEKAIPEVAVVARHPPLKFLRGHRRKDYAGATLV